MKPYKNIRNEEMDTHTDKADGMYRKASATGNKRGGCKNKEAKAQHRRSLKHTNRTKQLEIERKDAKLLDEMNRQDKRDLQ